MQLRRPWGPPLSLPLRRTRRPVFPPVGDPLPYLFSSPRRPYAPTSSASLDFASEVAPPPADAPPGTYYAPLPSDSFVVAVRILLTSPAPPAVLASSSDTNSSVSFPLHLALSAALSSVPVPPTRYFPPAPSSCVPTGGSAVICILPLAVVAVVSVASAVPLAALTLTRFSPLMSLVLPPAPLPPHPLPLGLLCLPAPPRAPPPPDPAANISRKDKDIGDYTGGGEARWPTAGRSALGGKFPRRPLSVVGYGISRPLLLHPPQQ